MAVPSKEEVERIARKSGMTPRAYCVSQIDQWQEMLAKVSDDYRGLSDEEFKKLVEQEKDD